MHIIILLLLKIKIYYKYKDDKQIMKILENFSLLEL